VPAKERNLVGDSAALLEGDDGECAAAAGFPVDCEVFGIGLGGMSLRFSRSRAGRADLDQVGVPGVLGDAEVIIALLLWSCEYWQILNIESTVPSSRPARRRGLQVRVIHVSLAEACDKTHDTWMLSQSGRPW
jgi:hypothetical protein